MTLPQVDLPLSEIKVHSLNKKFDFRPFRVKEEKILVMASESNDVADMMKATQQIITNCSMGKVDGSKLPLFALQKLFLDLRAISISNNVDLSLRCGECNEEYKHNLKLDELDVTYDPDHTNPIKLGDDVAIEMNYPDAVQFQTMMESDTMENIFNMTVECISKIYNGDEIIEAKTVAHEELLEWIENLTMEQFDKIKDFFATMPTLEHVIEFKCVKCEKDNYLGMNGYLNFFV